MEFSKEEIEILKEALKLFYVRTINVRHEHIAKELLKKLSQ